MPVFEFHCTRCEARFEELVGSHVGTGVEDVRCPECGAAEVERQTASEFSALNRVPTKNQRRRMEEKRGTDSDGAKQRFKAQRAAEKRARKEPGGG